MKRPKLNHPRAATALALVLCCGLIFTALGGRADPVDLNSFDHQGKKLFSAYDATPQTYMSADAVARNLNSYYELRQYPGSPPIIPHEANISFSGEESDCLSCHAKGGYSPEYGTFTPVTPHPEKELCYQCHAQVATKELFVESNWRSIRPPRLGRSFLGGSPPPTPHGLQNRENCISCHTGPGAVAEIRVDHSARGNCRQCHVTAVQTTPVKEFVRQP